MGDNVSLNSISLSLLSFPFTRHLQTPNHAACSIISLILTFSLLPQTLSIQTTSSCPVSPSQTVCTPFIWFRSGLAYAHTTNELLWRSFGTMPWPPPPKGLYADVKTIIAHGWWPKQTQQWVKQNKVWFKQTKHGRCQNTLKLNLNKAETPW